MTIQEFKLVDPGVDYILFFYSGTPTASISAINISTTDCRGANIYAVFQSLTNLSIPINGINYNFSVTGRTLYTTYAHFTVTPVSVPTADLTDQGTCTDIVTVPTLQSSEFKFSEYQAIQNNALDNRSVDFIFKVDRNKLTVSASNINAINAGNAELADYQELNYSSIGLANSRYAGAKTTEDEYGISPALSGIVTDGAVYAPSQTNGYICSQSFADRQVEDIIIGYDASSAASYSGTALYSEDLKINYISLAKFTFLSGSYPTYKNIQPGETTLTLNAYIDIYPEDIIKIKQGTAREEVMKVESVISKTSVETKFTVTRAYKVDVDPNNAAQTFYSTLTTTVSKPSGTTLFKSDSNKLYRLSNRKVWIKENSKIFYADEGGQVIFELTTCSI